MNRQEKLSFIDSEVLTVPEVLEYLQINKQRLSTLIQNNKLIPVKEVGSVRLFLKEDVEERKQEADILRDKYRPYDK